MYVYNGKVDTRGATTSLECAGVVTRVGTAVSSLKAGDRVVSMAPGHFCSLESFPEWACAKLEDHEDYTVSLSFHGLPKRPLCKEGLHGLTSCRFWDSYPWDFVSSY